VNAKNFGDLLELGFAIENTKKVSIVMRATDRTVEICDIVIRQTAGGVRCSTHPI